MTAARGGEARAAPGKAAAAPPGARPRGGGGDVGLGQAEEENGGFPSPGRGEPGPSSPGHTRGLTAGGHRAQGRSRGNPEKTTTGTHLPRRENAVLTPAPREGPPRRRRGHDPAGKNTVLPPSLALPGPARAHAGTTPHAARAGGRGAPTGRRPRRANFARRRRPAPAPGVGGRAEGATPARRKAPVSRGRAVADAGLPPVAGGGRRADGGGGEGRRGEREARKTRNPRREGAGAPGGGEVGLRGEGAPRGTDGPPGKRTGIPPPQTHRAAPRRPGRRPAPSCGTQTLGRAFQRPPPLHSPGHATAGRARTEPRGEAALVSFLRPSRPGPTRVGTRVPSGTPPRGQAGHETCPRQGASAGLPTPRGTGAGQRSRSKRGSGRARRGRGRASASLPPFGTRPQGARARGAPTTHAAGPPNTRRKRRPGPAGSSPTSEGGGAGRGRGREKEAASSRPPAPRGGGRTRRTPRYQATDRARGGATAGGFGTPRHPLGSLEKAFSPRAHRPRPIGSHPGSGPRRRTVPRDGRGRAPKGRGPNGTGESNGGNASARGRGRVHQRSEPVLPQASPSRPHRGPHPEVS